MTLNLRVMAPNRIVWNSKIQEIILSTNSGQIGILPNHAPLLRYRNCEDTSQRIMVHYGINGRLRHDGE